MLPLRNSNALFPQSAGDRVQKSRLFRFIIILIFILPAGCSGEVISDISEYTDVQVESGQISIRPTPRSGLEATDPTTVNLASGQVQMVEFFAFW